jgi:hypothetical protein
MMTELTLYGADCAHQSGLFWVELQVRNLAHTTVSANSAMGIGRTNPGAPWLLEVGGVLWKWAAQNTPASYHPAIERKWRKYCGIRCHGTDMSLSVALLHNGGRCVGPIIYRGGER